MMIYLREISASHLCHIRLRYWRGSKIIQSKDSEFFSTSFNTHEPNFYPGNGKVERLDQYFVIRSLEHISQSRARARKESHEKGTGVNISSAVHIIAILHEE